MTEASAFVEIPEMRRRLNEIGEILTRNVLHQMRPLPDLSQGSMFFNCVRYENGLDCDEVFPGILLGNAKVARNRHYLKDLHITHVLNCAQGDRFNMVSTDAAYYREVDIQFKGFKLDDTPLEDISRYFEQGADFIESCLRKDGRVFVHCLAGVSRSASMVIAYLMIKHQFSVEDAFRQVCRHRNIYPNTGFLRQLLQLDVKLSKKLAHHPNSKP